VAGRLLAVKQSETALAYMPVYSLLASGHYVALSSKRERGGAQHIALQNMADTLLKVGK